MSTIILISIHILIALITISVALALLISNFGNVKARAVGILMIVFALSEFAFGFELNALTTDQIVGWILVEFFVAYATPAASILVALYLFRPHLTKKWWITIPLWILILYPLVIGAMDITGISNSLFGTHLFLNITDMASMYSGGYLSISDVGSGPYYEFTRFTLILLFTAFLFFPLLFVMLKDRKSNPLYTKNAILLLVLTIITSLFQTVLQDTLPPTTSTAVANTLFSIGFFVAGYRIISAESRQEATFQNLFQNLSMGYKIAAATAAIVIPAIIFIGLTTSAFFQRSLLVVTEQNLSSRAARESELIASTFQESFIQLSLLEEDENLFSQFTERTQSYAGLSQSQIEESIAARDQAWQENNSFLASASTASNLSPQIRELFRNYPEFMDIILVDAYGSLVTAEISPAQVDFSQTDWWMHISSSDNDYVGPILEDTENQILYTVIALPLFDQNDRQLGGVAATINLNSLFTSIDRSSTGRIEYGIINNDATLISLNQPFSTERVTVPALAIENARTPEKQDTVPLWDSAYLLKVSDITSQENNFQFPWIFAAYQPVNLTMAPLSEARIGTLLTSILIIISAAAIIVLLTRSITQPLTELTSAANQILQGDRNISLNITSNDELGTLSDTFIQMAAEISTLVEGLEQVIEDRTQDLERRAVQLEASALVAEQANQIQDLTNLLDQTVELISEKFGYYHAGIFLLDEQRKYAVLEAANSTGGKRMLARGHKLQVGRVGVVGYCAGMGQPRIAQDVGADITYYDNPDMPHTRSEMALPMIVNDVVIGVVDVQSTEASAFSQEDIRILQVLANQIALAIEKARLLESSQKTLAELQKLYGEESALAWKQKLTGEEIAYQYSSTGFTKLLQEAHQTAEEVGNQLNKEIKYRGQVIGSLDFIRDEHEGKWTPEEEALIDDILEQTALALENARLVDQIKLRSDQINLLQQITAMAASTLDESILLNQVAEKLQTSLQLDQCGVILFDTLNDTSRLSASAPELVSLDSVPEIPLDEDPFLQDQDHSGTEIQVINGLQTASKYKTFTNTFNVETSNSLIVLPITFREAAVGYIYLAEEEIDRKMDPEEFNLYLQIQAQVSTAVESARLFAAEQQGREASAALLEITQISSASLDINEVLNEATYRSAEAIQAHRCTILLLDEREKIKPLISVYFDGNQMEEDEWDILVENIRSTYQPIPMRDLAASLRIPRYIDAPLTYEQFPLGWTRYFSIEKVLMVPLISQNKVIGTMIYDLISREKSFSQSQVELAQTIAGQIATTLENATLFDQAVRRAERERQVTEITAKIRASNDPKEIMDTAIAELRLALAKHDIQEKQKSTSTKTKITGSNGKDEL